MNTKRKITLEIFEEYEEVTFYTFKYDGEKFSEADKFLLNHIDEKELEEDLEIITKLFERIGKSGAEPRHFRHAGNKKDRTAAMPGYIYTKNKLRLYVIYLSSNIVIIGNGGVKKTKTYNEDPHLDNCVKELQEIDFKLNNGLKYNRITIVDNKLTGNLSFNI